MCSMQNLIALLSERISLAKNPFIIVIDGRSGSGKTTFSQLLSQVFDVEVIHTDDFSSADDPLDWYQRFLDSVLIPISNGSRHVCFQPTGSGNNIKPEKIYDIGDIVIIEGVSSSRKEFRAYIDFAIYVDIQKKF